MLMRTFVSPSLTLTRPMGLHLLQFLETLVQHLGGLSRFLTRA